ncbi:hypothetical protein ZIOFF_006833 [Zingiber officinale]|uniref:Integrase catalytic domain-containing protein n=1 Tax=Zingiber officinale TaxID=94328 RepID=A0A8J5HSU2_ZINOF|nr:hypothetical protein ZIOFF_006833 [Zingiber officinale]
MMRVAWRRWRAEVKATSYDPNIPLDELLQMRPVPHKLTLEALLNEAVKHHLQGMLEGTYPRQVHEQAFRHCQGYDTASDATKKFKEMKEKIKEAREAQRKVEMEQSMRRMQEQQFQNFIRIMQSMMVGTAGGSQGPETIWSYSFFTVSHFDILGVTEVSSILVFSTWYQSFGYFREEDYCSLDMEGTGRVAGLGLELLNQSNYRIWKTCMESYLVGEDLWDVVSTNGVVAPANIIENAEAFKKWKQQNAKAEFVLKRSISHGIFEHIIGCESAREIWQTLDRLFNKKSEARLQMLENELAVTKQEGWAQQPSLEELENLLSSQESLAKQMATTSIKEEPKSALFVKKAIFIKEKSENYANLADVDKKLEKEDDWKNCFLTDIVDTQRGTCLVAKETSHTKHPTNNEWIVDSSCGHHLTGDESTFSCSQLHDSGKGIITADNTIHKIQKEGTVVIDNNRGESITLNSVYHVPGIQKNLFSVANAVDAGNFVLFGPRDVKFLRNVKEIKADVVHTGTRVNDLFVLSASNSYIEKMSSNDNSSLWHARLGHLNMTKLKVMIQRKLVDGLPDLSKVEDEKICEGCQFGKAHRLPFKSSNSRCTTPLERIHSDLMGPTLTASYSGCHYMLLFVDDYTRFTWVYFVKHKSEVFSKFLKFKETVEGELCRKIKILRTDNGGEFCSNEFFSFCRNNGIKRELSCPETPQQNGVAEQKIRHLVETCKCWLHAKNLSKALWAEGIKCAAYVINRVPLRSSNNKAPYEFLFDAKPNVKYLRVFGSICYVHVSDSQRSKLDAKAIKCIFVGYDEQRKGWR